IARRYPLRSSGDAPMRTEITIDGADSAGANYIAWAPVHSSIRLVDADGGADSVDVLLRNQNPSNGGQIVFRDAIPGAEQDTLRLRLPADGTPVDFFIAGKFRHPSVADKDAVIEVVEANTEDVLSTNALMVRIRKNANELTEDERDRFLSAFAILNGGGNGRFSAFRAMHRQKNQRRSTQFPWLPRLAPGLPAGFGERAAADRPERRPAVLEVRSACSEPVHRRVHWRRG